MAERRSNKERVLRKYPDAVSVHDGNCRSQFFDWGIFNGNLMLGMGYTPKLAWADAADRLSPKGK